MAKKQQGISNGKPKVTKISKEIARTALFSDRITENQGIIKQRHPLFDDPIQTQQSALLESMSLLHGLMKKVFALENGIELGQGNMKVTSIFQAIEKNYESDIREVATHKELLTQNIQSIQSFFTALLPQIIIQLRDISSHKQKQVDGIQKQLSQVNKLLYDFYDLDTKGALLQKSEAAILEIVASTEATGHIDFLRSKLQSLQQALILPRQPDQPTTSELDQDPIYIIGQYLIDDDNFGYRGAELLEQISKISNELFKGLIKEKDELAQIRKKYQA